MQTPLLGCYEDTNTVIEPREQSHSFSLSDINKIVVIFNPFHYFKHSIKREVSPFILLNSYPPKYIHRSFYDSKLFGFFVLLAHAKP